MGASSSRDIDERNADERVRDAAHEMLAALREIADGLADTGSTPGKWMTRDPKQRAHHIARAAIAKATGGKP